MNRRYLPLVGALLILISVSAIRAEDIVKTGQINAANPAGKVKAILGPSKSDSVSPPKVTDVWVAFKTHFDIGYTDTIEGVLQKYRVKMMDSALGIIGQERQLPPEERFAWIIPGWPAAHILGPRQEPARKPRIEQAVREGTLTIQALPFSLHTESSDLEDLVRGMRFSSAIARKYGRPLPIAAKMTDVPCHSWVWPTVLAHAGVKFLQIGSNGASGHLRLPHLFWWQGPDGSRILCNYTPDYGSRMAAPKDWPAKNYLAMIMTGDNQGPPSLAEVENLRRYAEKNMPGIRVHFGTLDDFARAVLAEKPELPVVLADMPDTWIHGWLSMPIESKAAHTVRPLQPAVEALDTQLRAWGLTTGDLAPALAEAYEQSVLYSEHTFGPATPNMGSWNSGTLRDLYGAAWKADYDRGAYKKYEQVFDDKRAYARKEAEIVHRELRSRLDLLARSVGTAGPRVVVYNALPWRRSGLVEIPSQPGKFIYAEDVPASGYKTYPATSGTGILPGEQKHVGQAGKPDVRLETPFYRVAFDLRRGGIASLVERQTGRELVDRNSPYALGQFLHERFSNQQMADFTRAYARAGYNFARGGLPGDTKYAALTLPAWNLVVARAAHADVATLTATDTLGLAKGIALVVTLPREQPWVDVEWRVVEKTPDPVPEGGWLCFPLAVEQPHYTLGRLGGPIDPAKEIVPGANKDYFCLSTGLTIHGDDQDQSGVGICPIDSPCVSLGEPGLWRYSQVFQPKTPTVFVNLYNNEWNTNFPEWQDGSWSSRVRLWPTQGAEVAKNLIGQDVGKNLIVPAWEARLPLLAAAADGPQGPLPAAQAGLTLSRPGVLVTAFGADPDGVQTGTLLRVWEQSGVSGPVMVTLPAGLNATTATPLNLRGEKLWPAVDIRNGTMTFDLGKYAPASFILKR